MPGWADRKLDEMAKRKDDERLRNEQVAREHALTLAEAPRLWDELDRILTQEIRRYNEAFPSHLAITDVPSEPDTSAKILQSSEAEVTLTFHRKVPRIYYAAKMADGPLSSRKPDGAGSFVFEVRKQNEVWLVHVTRGNRESAYDVVAAAGMLLDFLVA